MTDTQQELFNKVHSILHGVQHRSGDKDFHADCPFCGKPVKKGHTHFSYNRKGFICFPCTTDAGRKGGGLVTLLKHLGADYKLPPDYQPPKPVKKEVTRWPLSLIRQYTRHPDKYRLWWNYRRLTKKTVDKWKLGIGYLPKEYPRYLRLIMPIFRFDENGCYCPIVRGRLIEAEQLPDGYDYHPLINGVEPAKWLTNGRPIQLYGLLDTWKKGDIYIINNMAGALLARQHHSGMWMAIAGGENSWQSTWGETICNLKPRMVVVAMDNDKEGRAGQQKIVRNLITSGIPEFRVHSYVWRHDAPDKADIDGILMEYLDTRKGT